MARAAMKIVESGRVTDETRSSSNEMHRCACCRSRGQVRRGNLLVLKAQHHFGRVALELLLRRVRHCEGVADIFHS